MRVSKLQETIDAVRIAVENVQWFRFLTETDHRHFTPHFKVIAMNNDSWRQVTWDGALPVLIALCPFAVRCCFPDGHIVEVVAAVIAPVLAAFARGAIGIYQLETICDGRPELWRQVLFAIGIMLLLLVEVIVSTLQFTNNEPWTVWFFPAGLFCFYLSAMQHALAPEPEDDWQLAHTFENLD